MKIALRRDALGLAYIQHADLLRASDKYDIIVERRLLTAEMLRDYRRILLVERQDSATIGPARKWLDHPHVACLLKMQYYDSIEIQNRPMVGERVFIPLDGTEEAPQQITPEGMAKVRCGLNFYHCGPAAEAWRYRHRHAPVPHEQRRYDAAFLGTTEYCSQGTAGAWITEHRRRMVAALEAKWGDGVCLSRHRVLSHAEYLGVMANARVAPSPFGWGEYCHRDYEALILGCIVEKPVFDEGYFLRDIHNLWPFSPDKELPPEPGQDARSVINQLLR